MTLRQVLVQAGLATAALLVAYATWQRAPELATDEALALDIAKNDLVSARFDDMEKHTWVELARSTDDNGAFVTVHLAPQDKPGSAKPPVKPADKPDAKAPEAKPAEQTPDRLVRGSDAAEKLFASFAPLRANRRLGVLDAAKLKELGLDTTQKRITLSLRDGKRVFAIAPAPPGGSLPYLRDEASGQVFVVGRAFLSDFQVATSSLVERKAHAFRIEETDCLAVTQGAVKREIVVMRGESSVQLAPANTPDKPDAALKTWHDKVFSLWPSEVLGRGEVPAEGEPQVALRIDYSMRGRRLGFVEIGRVAPLTTSSEGGKDTLFARNERTLGWVKLGADAQNVLTDAQPLFRP